jgi:hypothetical protein
MSKRPRPKDVDSDANDAEEIVALKRRRAETAKKFKDQKTAKRKKTRSAAPEDFAAAFSRALSGPAANSTTANAPAAELFSNSDDSDADSGSVASSVASEDDDHDVPEAAAAAGHSGIMLGALEKSREKKAAEAKVDEAKRRERRREAVAARERFHVLPAQDPTALGDEKTLRKMATAGVVKLFNALTKAQTAAQKAEDAQGGMESFGGRKNVEHQTRKAFEQGIKNSSSSSSHPTPGKKDWDALRDDYMTNKTKKIK